MRLILVPIILTATLVRADPPEIVGAELSPDGRLSVTLRHGDTGWDHYADGWRLETEDGTVLVTRVLAHPHVNEQPFTRALFDVVLPDETGPLYLRASCNRDGWATERVALQ